MDPIDMKAMSIINGINTEENIAATLCNNMKNFNLDENFRHVQPKSRKQVLRPESKSFVSATATNGTSTFLNYKNDAPLREFIPRGEHINNLINNGAGSEHLKLRNKKSPFQAKDPALVQEFIPQKLWTISHKSEIGEILNSSQASIDTNDCDPASNITYQVENVNGTVYFYTENPMDNLPRPPNSSLEIADISLINGAPVVTPNGTALINPTLIPDPTVPVYYTPDGLQTNLMIPHTTEMYIELPEKVGENYCDVQPLEDIAVLKPSRVLKGYVTTVYKVNNIKLDKQFFMRRVHNTMLPNTKCNAIINMWKKISHTNLVPLKEVFQTRDFGDNSLVFIYDYHEDAETLLAKHFPGQTDDTFSSNPNAPRPYSHSKNALLREQHNNAIISESVLWYYAIQLTGALKVIHAAGLACRCLDLSKIIITSRNRVRLTDLAIFDVILYEFSQAQTNRLQATAQYQQEDLLALGKILLSLSCRSLSAAREENLKTSLDLMPKSYSNDFKNLVSTLLYPTPRRGVPEVMPFIGARFYSHIDAVQSQCDNLESDNRKYLDYNDLLTLFIKLTCINEWPDPDQEWADPNDRYTLTLFHEFLFKRMSVEQKPYIDINHILITLSKLLRGSSENICLAPNEVEPVVMSYGDLKECFERSYDDLINYSVSIGDGNAATNSNGKSALIGGLAAVAAASSMPMQPL